MVFEFDGLKILVTVLIRYWQDIAEVLLEEGAMVTINSKYCDKVDGVDNELKKIGHVYGVATDLTEEDDVYRLVLKVHKLMNGLDAAIYSRAPKTD